MKPESISNGKLLRYPIAASCMDAPFIEFFNKFQGNCEIKGYLVQFKLLREEDWQDFFQVIKADKTPRAHVDGLRSGDKYEFRVSLLPCSNLDHL